MNDDTFKLSLVLIVGVVAVVALFTLLTDTSEERTVAGDATAGTGTDAKRCYKHVKRAKKMIGNRPCTMQVQEMQCPIGSWTYTAKNGCVIEELKKLGWTPVPAEEGRANAGGNAPRRPTKQGMCEEELRRAQEITGNQPCTMQTATLRCDDGTMTYQAKNGCEIDALRNMGWNLVTDSGDAQGGARDTGGAVR